MTKSQYRQRQSQLLTGYGAICLERVGDYAIVSVEAMPGKWVEVIREQINGNFHHTVIPPRAVPGVQSEREPPERNT